MMIVRRLKFNIKVWWSGWDWRRMRKKPIIRIYRDYDFHYVAEAATPYTEEDRKKELERLEDFYSKPY